MTDRPPAAKMRAPPAVQVRSLFAPQGCRQEARQYLPAPAEGRAAPRLGAAAAATRASELPARRLPPHAGCLCVGGPLWRCPCAPRFSPGRCVNCGLKSGRGRAVFKAVTCAGTASRRLGAGERWLPRPVSDRLA